MPRYLGQDYVAQVLSKKRQLLCRLLLPCPEHLDEVGSYCHKGSIDRSYYSDPWKFIEGNDMGGLPCVNERVYQREASLNDIASIPSLLSDFDDLLHGVQTFSFNELKLFTEADNPCSPELIGPVRSRDDMFNDTMSIAIDSAMAEMEDIVKCESYTCEHLDKEDVFEESSFEEMLDSSFLHLGLLGLPSVLDLLSRLQPKPVQDPFINSRGKHYSHFSVFQKDLGPPYHQEEPDIVHTVKLFSKESHLPSLQTMSDEETVAINNNCEEVPYLIEPWSCSPTPGMAQLSPDLPETDIWDCIDDREDKDWEAFRVWCLPQECFQLERRTSEEGATDQDHMAQRDFATINHESLPESYDSGCQLAYLESPTLVELSPCCKDSGVVVGGEVFEKLEPLPISPEVDFRKMHVITPQEEKNLLKKVRSKEMMFDDILAYLLPIPHCKAASSKPPSVSEVMLLCELTPEDVDSEFEFVLSWDPLYYAIDAMTVVQDVLRSGVYKDGSDASARLQHHIHPHNPVEFSKYHLEQATEEPYMSLFEEPTDVLSKTRHQIEELCSPQALQCRNESMVGSGRQSHNNHHGSRLYAGLSSSSTTTTKTTTTTTKRTVTVQKCSLSSEMSPLDLFMVMRSSGEEKGEQLSEIVHSPNQGQKSHSNKKKEETFEQDQPIQSDPKTTGSRVVEDVPLTGVFLKAFQTLSHHGQIAMDMLNGLGVRIPPNFTEMSGETSKFYLRQQEKALQNSNTEENARALLESCHWCAVLVVLSSTTECLKDTSLSMALNIFLALMEKYAHYIHDALDSVSSELGKLQVTAGEQGTLHPKVDRLVSKLAQWVSQKGTCGILKSVVVIAGEFTPVSTEVMNALDMVDGLSACVFSLAPGHEGDVEYLQEADSRVHHYSCLLLPLSCCTELFPWERISLVVEYNLPSCDTSGLDHSTSVGDHIPLVSRHASLMKKHAHIDVHVLRGVLSNGPHTGTLSCTTRRPGNVAYKLICSQTITSEVTLLQLLESRFNIVILERDYDRLCHHSNNGAPLAKPLLQYADIIYDERCGAIVVPLGLLATPDGFKSITNRIMSLSLQFVKLWILLYNSENGSYMYSGHTPVNIAKLHASIAVFDSKRDSFTGKVLIANSLNETAYIIRALGEWSHHNSEFWNSRDWPKRDWLTEELSAHERFLLHFPCLNAFSAQLMLTMSSLKDLVTADKSVLKQLCAIIPTKCLEMFASITHTSVVDRAAPGSTKVSHTHNLPLYNRLRHQPEMPHFVQSTSKTGAQAPLPQNSQLISSLHAGAVVPTFDLKSKDQPLEASLDELLGSRMKSFPQITTQHPGERSSSIAPNMVQHETPIEPGRKKVKSTYRYSNSGGLPVGGVSGTEGNLDIKNTTHHFQSSATPSGVVRSKYFPSNIQDTMGSAKGLKRLLAFGQCNKAVKEKVLTAQPRYPAWTTSTANLSFGSNTGSTQLEDMALNVNKVGAGVDLLNTSSAVAATVPGHDNGGVEVKRRGWKEVSLLTTPTTRERQPVRCLDLEEPSSGLMNPYTRKRDCGLLSPNQLFLDKRPKSSQLEDRVSGGWDGDCDRELHRGQFDLHSFHIQQASGNQDQVQFGSWNLNSDSNVGMTISSIPSTSCSHGENRSEDPNLESIPLAGTKVSKWSHWVGGDLGQVTSGSLFGQTRWPSVATTPPQTVPRSRRI